MRNSALAVILSFLFCTLGFSQENSAEKTTTETKPDFYQQGIQHSKLYEFDEALKSFEQAEIERPNDPRIPFQMAMIYLYLEDLNRANELLVKAQQLYAKTRDDYSWKMVTNLIRDLPKVYADILYRKGLENGANGFFPIAKEKLKKSLELDAVDNEAAKQLRLIEDFEKGILPKNYLQKLFKALDYLQSRKYEPAIAQLQEAVAIFPKYARAYGLMGWTYERLGDPTQALEQFQKSVEADPTFVNGHFSIGLQLIKSGHPQEAKISFEKVIELDPQYAGAYLELGIIEYEVNKDFGKCIKLENKAMELKPEDFLSYYHAGYCSMKLEKNQEAILLLKKAISINPNHAMATYYLGDIYSYLRDPVNCRKYWTMALELFIEQGNAPMAKQTERYIITIPSEHEDEGALSKAIADYDKSIQANPSQYITYNNRGFAYFKKGNLSLAIADFTSAIERHSNHVGYFYRGLAYYTDEQYDKALEDYKKGVAINPQDETALNDFIKFVPERKLSDKTNIRAQILQILSLQLNTPKEN